jgi:2-polyprenyl-3-methyl-5-hydroxy-6-metoxy-1,4-benzoquinol methylase
MDVKEERVLGDAVSAHWYYASKARALRQYLRGIPTSKILDIGAGSGVFSKMLIDAGVTSSSWCVDPGYAHEYDQKYGAGLIQFRRKAPSSIVQDVDLALMMDVLEHVDDDVALLAEYASMLQPGRHVLITVPAFQALWSAHDVFLEHRRRYSLRQLEDVVRSAGLHLKHASYFFALILPIAAAARLKDRKRMDAQQIEPRSSLRPHGAFVNTALMLVNALELPLLRLNRLGGLSIFCMAEIPAAYR